MESLYAYFDGEKLVPEKLIEFQKGQKVMLTILDTHPGLLDETAMMYKTALESESFDYVFKEGEAEYTKDDCKIKFK